MDARPGGGSVRGREKRKWISRFSGLLEVHREEGQVEPRPGEAESRACDPAGARQRARLQRPPDRGAVAPTRHRRLPTPSRSTWAGSARRSSPGGHAEPSGRALRRPGPPGTCFASSPTSSTPTGSSAWSARGREAGVARDPATAVASAARKRSTLWRGPALADFAYEPVRPGGDRPARGAAARRGRGPDGGRPRPRAAAADLVGELEALIGDNPLRERLRGQLMLALYRAGRQADALEVYNDTRTDPRRGARPRAEPAATAPAGRDPPPGAGARGLDRDAGRPEPQAPAPDAAAPEVRKTVTVLIGAPAERPRAWTPRRSATRTSSTARTSPRTVERYGGSDRQQPRRRGDGGLRGSERPRGRCVPRCRGGVRDPRRPGWGCDRLGHPATGRDRHGRGPGERFRRRSSP